MKTRPLLLGCLMLALAACATPSPQQRLDAAVRSRPLVLLGEVHDNPEQHAERARALQSLVAGGARPALLMEAFDGERQAELDRALAAPGATPDSVIAAAGGGGWQWPLYKPYIALALAHGLPIVAANVSRNDARRVLAEGLAARGFDPQVPGDVHQAQAEAIVQGHCGQIDLTQAGRLVQAQVARDQFMARLLETHAARGAVLLAGNGHVRRDVGVPRWLTPAARARSVAIGLLEPGPGDTAAYDVALVTPAATRDDPCAALRRANPSDKPADTTTR